METAATVTGVEPIDATAFENAWESLARCERRSLECVDACLSEDDVASMAECIRRDLDCAAACAATRGALTRWRSWDPFAVTALLDACIVVSARSADECLRHDHEHCRRCGEQSRECEAMCRALAAEIDRVVAQAMPA